MKVETSQGKSRVGNVQSVTDEAIQIGKNQSIPKQDVKQVLLRSPGHHGRNALIGLGIGSGFGLGTALTCTGKGFDWDKKACMAISIPFFGGLGAGIGALLPSNGKWHEVYRSK